MNKKLFIFVCLTALVVIDCFAVSCSNNYNEITGLSGSAFMAPTNNSCDAPGYVLTNIPDGFELFYSGLIIGDEITLSTKLGTRTYAVQSVEKIGEIDSKHVAPTSENCITLFTCVRDESEFRWCVRAVEKA